MSPLTTFQKSVALCLLSSSAAVQAFYLSFNPTVFKDNDRVPLFVNKVFSDKTQLPLAYYDLPVVCKPETIEEHELNLGEVLRGDRIMKSKLQVFMGQDVDCEVLCTVSDISTESIEFTKGLIRDQYRAEWILDDLPSATASVIIKDDGNKIKQYDTGFPLGTFDEAEQKAILYNHLNLKLYYESRPETNDKLVVGVANTEGTCPELVHSTDYPHLVLDELDEPRNITWTYSVKWFEETQVKWANRWALYMSTNDPQIHWYSIINSLVILLFLTAMVAIIILRTLARDIAIYNDTEAKVALRLRSKWRRGEITLKQLHQNFRKTQKKRRDGSCSMETFLGRLGRFLSALVGGGVQILSMVTITTALSMMGILNPAFRGGLLSAALFVFVFSGYVVYAVYGSIRGFHDQNYGSYLPIFDRAFAGYYSSRIYKAFRQESWRKNAFLTATLCPGIIMSVIFILNIFVWARRGSTAIPFGTFFALGSMFFGISMPLVYVGAYFGDRKQVGTLTPARSSKLVLKRNSLLIHPSQSIDHPVRSHQIPRQIPDQPWYMHPIAVVFITGLIPFAVIFLELFFLLKSVWHATQTYYMFGFLGLVILLLALTCIEITIVSIYFQLSAEDWAWHWRAFLVGGSSAVYIMLYAMWFWLTKLEMSDALSGIIYLGYSFLACFMYWYVERIPRIASALEGD
ncbi:hypothetical protein HK104_009908 [Borealophlyctis nickersoniae]|nr:hypothetical protein HK104_009908 [Borealophlyctis nickersoniae]